MSSPGSRTHLRHRVVRAAAAFALACAPFAAAARQLDAAAAEPFLGEWKLAMEIQGNPVEMTLLVVAEDGGTVAYLTSPRSPEPQKIVDVARDGEALALSWQRDMGGQTAGLHLKLAPAGSGLAGDFGDATGFFSARVTGTRAGDAGGGQQARRRRPGGGQAVLALDAGEIGIGFEPLDREKNARDYAALVALEPGEVFAFDGGRAIKLKSVPSLRFGETTVQAGNAAPGYPGVYSLWLERTEQGWNLVFNQHPDIWGSQHEAEADVARVPLRDAATDAEKPKLDLSLEGAGDAGTLTIAWGVHRWSADFVAVAP
ncbi:MAG TPA: DUF2911 domain-containing protein [Thermoanaerobaculia bacterium]|nr:DUF2911 domain-containing protein [Thermoanaerobaculia bacterium]